MDNRYLYRAKMKNKNEWALGSLVHVPHQDEYYNPKAYGKRDV